MMRRSGGERKAPDEGRGNSDTTDSANEKAGADTPTSFVNPPL
jgi:hypothetical protein